MLLRLITICSLLSVAASSVHPAFAAISSNSDYSVEFGDISTDNPEPTRKPAIILKQIQPAMPAIVNAPPVTPPFSFNSSNDSIALGLSQITIDFGVLSATNPVTRTSVISFVSPIQGAKVISFEDHPLLSADRQIIPDTTCDNGSCSQVVPALWNSNLTYGFGYRCETSLNKACDNSFATDETYKQFSDSSASEPPQSIALNTQPNQKDEASILYKMNISGTQAAGGYNNTVTYIAVPNF